ncbi:transcription termination factor MTERF6, chloroplastic/mitochondrial-like [Canna indica]|uniref:Transcription termination factor MTERF6, chloroplastic/mitochondrial-like n=1 Tax=Canna indica TaxID=4628 RepID=A0AAQ3QDK3_9LILI|nr:transcription termination factor MTERF6, chloroplastic/mitochondrial-like [Canna indica]
MWRRSSSRSFELYATLAIQNATSSIIKNVVLPNLKFLRDECGIPEERVYLVLSKNPGLAIQKPISLRALVARAEELGIPRQSSKLIWTLYVLRMVSKERYEAKVKLMKSLGWSDSEFVSAIQRSATFLGFSQEALLRKMNFWVKEVGCKPSYIASRPELLTYSLEKRLIPRFHVMEMLKSKGLRNVQQQPSSFFSLSHAKFRDKFVLCYKDEVPELLDILGVVNE